MTKLSENKKNEYILTEEEKEYLVALNASESFKKNFRKLIEHFGSLKGVYQAGQTELKGVSCLCSRSIDAILKIRENFKVGFGMERIKKKDISLVSWWDTDYPSALRTIAEPPPLLYVRGNPSYEYELSISIVGTRRASRHGIEQAHRFGKELGSLGFTIISGGASGIDVEAHKGALEANAKTLAVFGSGIDVYFPANHARLFDKIAEKGALITEFPPGTPPEPYRFPVRNRIISGLTKGVLVVQAPERSGALITAEYAAEQGREVMALPGRNDNPFCRGANLLLRDGAKMVLDPEDIPAIYNLLIIKRVNKEKKLPELDEVSKRIIDAMGWEPCHIDELSRQTGIPVSELSSKLLGMLMDEHVRELPGKRYVRTSA